MRGKKKQNEGKWKKTDKQKDVKRKQKSDSFGTILVSCLTSQVFEYLCASVLELKDTRQPFFYYYSFVENAQC